MVEVKHIVALSGGKDSSAMALLLREKNPSRRYEYVITPTGDELPEMHAHWQKLENILGQPLKRIGGGKTLFDIIRRKGAIPNFRMRFCTRELKIEPFIKYMSEQDPESIMYVGLRVDEPGRLGVIDSQINTEYPLRDAKWGINEVTGYLRTLGVEIPERTDCGCCFFQRLPEWRSLLEKHPERYEKYVRIEKKYGHTFRSPSRDTWPADLAGLRREILSGRKMRNTKSKGAAKCRMCTL